MVRIKKVKVAGNKYKKIAVYADGTVRSLGTASKNKSGLDRKKRK